MLLGLSKILFIDDFIDELSHKTMSNQERNILVVLLYIHKVERENFEKANLLI